MISADKKYRTTFFRRWISCVLWLIGSGLFFHARAQNIIYSNDELNAWHKGTVWLASGDSLEGYLRIDYNRELLEVDMVTSMRALSPRQVYAFVWFDSLRNAPQIFYSLHYAVKRNYKAPLFFEMQLDGRKLSLLSRDKILSEAVPSRDPYSGQTHFYTYHRVVQELFVRQSNGDIILLDKLQSQLSDFFGNDDKRMKEHIKTHRLRAENLSDLISILLYYNSLD